MPLEDLTGVDKFIDDLVATNPVGGTDLWNTLDNHIRGLKNVLKNTWPNITAAITKTAAQINDLLERGGGTMSGALSLADNELQRPCLVDYSEKVVTVAASTAAYAANFETGNVFDITLTDNCAFTFTNPPAAGKRGKVELWIRQNGVGGFVPTWPASVKWAYGFAPVISTVANSLTVIQLATLDAGTTYIGLFGGSDFA